MSLFPGGVSIDQYDAAIRLSRTLVPKHVLAVHEFSLRITVRPPFIVLHRDIALLKRHRTAFNALWSLVILVAVLAVVFAPRAQSNERLAGAIGIAVFAVMMMLVVSWATREAIDENNDNTAPMLSFSQDDGIVHALGQNLKLARQCTLLIAEHRYRDETLPNATKWRQRRVVTILIHSQSVNTLIPLHNSQRIGKSIQRLFTRFAQQSGMPIVEIPTPPAISSKGLPSDFVSWLALPD